MLPPLHVVIVCHAMVSALTLSMYAEQLAGTTKSIYSAQSVFHLRLSLWSHGGLGGHGGRRSRYLGNEVIVACGLGDIVECQPWASLSWLGCLELEGHPLPSLFSPG